MTSASIAAMISVPLGSNWNENMVFAGGYHYNDEVNIADQIISQVQSSVQNSKIISGDDTIGSGNNFNFQNQENLGNSALAQSSSDDIDEGNVASQIIEQSQSSEQNSFIVSGDDTIGSGNNFNFQNQENSGKNALGQQ